jgi:hypothetical protein
MQFRPRHLLDMSRKQLEMPQISENHQWVLFQGSDPKPQFMKIFRLRIRVTPSIIPDSKALALCQPWCRKVMLFRKRTGN